MSKPGYKTTEFWLSLAATTIGALFASGVFPSDGAWDKALGVLASILGALGYTVSRALTKSADARAAAARDTAVALGPPSAGP